MPADPAAAVPVPDDDDYRRLLDLRTGLRQFLHWSEQQATAVGITPAQHQLLLAIRGHAGDRSPTIEAGLVVRHTDRVDHRIVRLGLTPLGTRRLRQLSGSHLEELRRLAPRIRSLWANLDQVERNGERKR
jgi:hypothetical protein